MTRELQSGQYTIRRASDPQAGPTVGVDPSHEHHVPIVADGSDVDWTAKRLDNGLYTLTLGVEEPVWYAKHHEGHVFASREGPPSTWSITPREDGAGGYFIQVPNRIRPDAWTLEFIEPKTPVTLQPIGDEYFNQRWYFLPILRE